MPYQELVPFTKLEIKAVNAYVEQRDAEYPNLHKVIGKFETIIIYTFIGLSTHLIPKFSDKNLCF